MLDKMTYLEFKKYIQDKINENSQRAESGEYSNRVMGNLEAWRDRIKDFLDPSMNIEVVPFHDIETCGFIFTDKNYMPVAIAIDTLES